jgi:para-nitrobenzyl esterase
MIMTDANENFSGAMTRRSFLAGGSAALVGVSFARDAWGLATPSNPSYVEVETTYGRVRGAQGDGVVRFRGIPYAGSVSGPNRFKAAPPLQPWKGVRDALQFGPPSIQPSRRGRGPSYQPAPAEDCLFLNIWTPAADGRKRPVMFYNHGGGFTTGSAAAPYQDGSNLARVWDVVVVATNHRLGLLGYLYLGALGGEEYATSGNQGLEDIRDGLRWVGDNIERFGGDPDNVMIFGESGGGAKTSCLYAMPSASPYFNKASIESGPGLRLQTLDAAIANTNRVLKQLGLERSQWRRLLEIPADKLLQVQMGPGRRGRAPSARGARGRGRGPSTFGGFSLENRLANARYGFTWSGAGGSFGPIHDGHVMPFNPFYPAAVAISKNKPLMVGYNRDEMNFFFAQFGATAVYSLTETTLKQRLDAELGKDAAPVLAAYKKSRPNASPSDLYVAISTALFDVIGSTRIAERKYEQHGAPVYMYCFVHESKRLIPGTNHIFGAAHAGEIVYKFDNVPSPDTGLPGMRFPGGGIFGGSDPSSLQTARNMSGLWSAFARTGHPAAKGQPAWPPYTTPKRATMLIDAQCKVVDDPWKLERQVWDQIDPG